MEKVLFKKISINFIITGIIVVCLYSFGTYKKYKDMAFNDCNELLNQVSESYEDAQTNLEDKIKIYEEDYLNRTYAVDFILKNNIDIRSNEGLKEITNLMRVDSIYVVDHDGDIILSNEKESIGINLLKYEEARKFWDLIKGTNSNDSVVDTDAKNILENKQECFIGIKSSVDDYSMIQIGFDKNEITKLEKEASINTILNDIPTTYDTTIFAIDKNSGDILGITKNNEQNINFHGDKSNEKILELLDKSSDGNTLKINGSHKFLKSKVIDDNIILVGFRDTKNLFNQIIIKFLYCVSIVGFIFCMLMFTLKRYFKKYVFDDFNMIENNIKEIISGKLNISFKANNMELQSVTETLNSWKDSYKYKSSRMSKLISNIGENVGLFECTHYINKNFFSDNLQYILGIDDTKWNEIKESPNNFEYYIKELMTLANDEGIIHINNKYLIIQSYNIEDEFFGIIIDKSDEIEKSERMLKKLQEVRCAAEKDNLTNLLNRNAFEKYVEKSLLDNPGKGTMLIFDLDNFKTINDTLGHPEGDKVLKIVSSCLRYEFRKEDIIARLGGDEFVVFIDHNVPAEILDSKLESLLDSIRKRLSNYYKNYNVSTSIGVAYVDNKIYDYQDLYRCSDAALYIAKRLGKDRYHVNEDNIRCMRDECIECTGDCKKKKVLGL